MRRSVVFRHASLTLVIAAGILLASLTAAPPAQAATRVDAGTYQESSAAVDYSGSWTWLESTGSSGEAIRFSDDPGASATLTFSGPNVTWYTWHSPSAGIAHVYIDGVRRATVDNYESSTRDGVVGFSAQDLSAGTHTISIRASGAANPASSGTITHFDSIVVGAERDFSPKNTAPYRYDACPDPTVRVSTASQLTEALDDASPGTSIQLAPGTYRGGFRIAQSGTASRPIWICGPRTAVVQGESLELGTALRLTNVEHVRVAGFTVSGALQGVNVKHSRYVTVADLMVKDVGYEGIHLYGNTTDSGVLNNTIARTGSVDVAYGEGIYIGTSQRRWDEIMGGAPDRSDRNTIIYNTVIDAGAEPIEAKEGTSDGRIEGNVIDGHRSGSRAIAWVLVTGNDWVVVDNSGTGAVENGYASMWWDDWGYRNKFAGNTGDVGASGYGIWVHGADRGVAVRCDNRVTGARDGVTNVYCTP